MLFGAKYAENYAGIIGRGLHAVVVKAESDDLRCYFEAVSFISDRLWLRVRPRGSTAVAWN